MISPETQGPAVDSSPVEHLRLFSPDLYTGSVAEQGPQDDAYAWVRLARFLDFRSEAIGKTEGEILCVDLCSSFPIYAALLRQRQFRATFEAATRITSSLSVAVGRPDMVDLPYIAEGATSYVRTALSGGLLRVPVDDALDVKQGLTSVATDMLVNHAEIIASEHDRGERQVLAEAIAGSLLRAERRFVTRDPNTSGQLEARWHLGFSTKRSERTILQALETMTVPSEPKTYIDTDGRVAVRDKFSKVASRYLGEVGAVGVVNDLGRFIGRSVAEIARPHRAISVDNRKPSELLSRASSSFEADISGSEMFRDAIDLKDHYEQGIFEFAQDQPDDSVTLYTCFEGFPMYFGSPKDEVAKNIHRQDLIRFATNIHRTLKKGGIALFFPWEAQPQSEDNRVMLDNLVRHWKRIGAEIELKYYHREEVLEWMTSTERKIAEERSPILRSGEEMIHMLIVRKPKSGTSTPWTTKAVQYSQHPTE